MSGKETSTSKKGSDGGRVANSNKKDGSKGTTPKDAAKSLLVLARQDKEMAYRQKLLRIFLQIGASFSDVKEVYEMSPRCLNRDLLFEAGKLGLSPKILKFLLEKFVAELIRFDDLPRYLRPSWCSKKYFTLQKDPHLLTSGNILLGLQQILLSNVVTLKAFAPEEIVNTKTKVPSDCGTHVITKVGPPITVIKPFWNLHEFIEFLGDITKSKHLKTFQFSFPKDYTPPKPAPTPAAKKDQPSEPPKELATAPCQSESQPTTNTKEPSKKSKAMPDRIKAKLQSGKKLESCVLRDVRIKFDYSHKTSDSLLQLVRSLGNLPQLKTFAIQLQKSASKPQGFQQFKAELPQAISKLISTSKTLKSVVIDAADWKKEADWEPLLPPLQKNPSLKRLLIRGFSPPTEAATKALSKKYTKDQALHTSLESFKRKLLEIVEHHNITLTDVRFVIPGCHCNALFKFDADDCFTTLAAGKPACSQDMAPKSNGKRDIPPPKHVPELPHLLSLNAHGRGKLRVPGLTHKKFLEAVTTNDDRFLTNVPVLYALLRGKTEYVPMLYSKLRQGPHSHNAENPEMEELHLAAGGRLALPLERFADLCVRRQDDFSALYELLRLFPTVWLDHLRTAKQIVSEQTKRITKKDYVSVVELSERTQIVRTGTKIIAVANGDKTHRLAVYGTRIVHPMDRSSKKSSQSKQKPLKVIRLNVAPSVGGATLTKFPKLVIGPKGNVVFVVPRRKKADETASNLPTTTSNSTVSQKLPAAKKKKAKVPLQDQSNQLVIRNTTADTTTSKKPKAAKPKMAKENVGKVGKRETANVSSKHKSGNSKARKSKATTSLLKIEGLDDSMFDDFDHDDSSVEFIVARKLVRRRSTTGRRKAPVPKKKTSNSPLADLIGEESEEEEHFAAKKGDDSDFDSPGEDDTEEEDESDWEE